MANNPTAKTYEEALEMELSKVGCNFEYLIGGVEREAISIGEQFKGQISIQSWDDMMISKEYVTKIIGKPLTLDRVLIALKYYVDYELLDMSLTLRNSGTVYGGINGTIELFKWDLTKETLEEQSEETQRKINELINEI